MRQIAGLIILAAACGAAPSSQPAGSQPATQPAPLAFELRFDAQVCAGPFTGRVWLMTSKRPEPRFGPDWFDTEPFCALEVRDWKPGEPLRIDAAAPVSAYPAPLARWAKSTMRVQAIMELNVRNGRRGPQAAGNACSAAKRVRLDPQTLGTVALKIDRVATPPRLISDERIRLVEIESRLLTHFFGHPVKMRAAVCLPEAGASANGQRTPTVYDIPGFGGDVRNILMYRARPPDVDEPLTYVVLDPNCPTGHHVFADSANNGPWARALVEELIPHLERTLPLVAEPRGRFLTGGSSGGWASLWLQINHPDFFNGTWSCAPDPVDFHDFTGIDLYAAGVNAYRDEQGALRPVARQRGAVSIYFRDFALMERVVGPGGQIGSFEAVFSPRGANGAPLPLFDRESGAVDPRTVEAWRAFDISRVLRRRWAELAPKLAGKLHIFCGDADTFYLDGAVRRLEQTLRELGSDAEVRLLTGRTHFDLYRAPEVRGRYQAMLDRFRGRAHPTTRDATTQPTSQPATRRRAA
ncbi:MAG: alpha/beta hydrolase-fold protein [Phycisphaerae bacterium]